MTVLRLGPELRRRAFCVIDKAKTPSERKERIMRAYEMGHLTAQEAQEWIISAGLAHE